MAGGRQKLIERLTVELGAEATKLIVGLQEAEGATKKSTATMGRSWDELRARAEALASSVGGFLMRTLVATVHQLKAKAAESIAAADAFNKLSQRVGDTSERLSTMDYALDRSGATMEDAEKGWQHLSSVLHLGGVGAARTAASLDAIGVSAEDLERQRPVDQLLTIAAGLDHIKDGGAKSAAVMALFGKEAGPKLIPLLNQGRDGIEALMERARELGLEVSTKFARDAEVFNDLMADLDDQSGQFARTLAMATVPELNRLIQAFNDGSKAGGVLEGILLAGDEAWTTFVDSGTEAMYALAHQGMELKASLVKSLGLEWYYRSDLEWYKARQAEIEQAHDALLAAREKREEEAAAADAARATERKAGELDLQRARDAARDVETTARAEASAIAGLEGQIQKTEQLSQVERVRSEIAGGAYAQFTQASQARLLSLATELDKIKAITEAQRIQTQEEKSLQDLRQRLELAKAMTAEERSQIEIRQKASEFTDPDRRAEFERLSMELEARKLQDEQEKQRAAEEKRATEEQARAVEQLLEKHQSLEEQKTQEIARVRELAQVNEAVRSREGELVADIEARYEQLGKKSTEVTTGIAEKGNAAAQQLRTGFVDLLLDPVNHGFDDMGRRFTDTLKKMAAEQLASGLFGGKGGKGAGGGLGSLLGFSGGGPVRGPGTETSDSITARLSRNEYVVRARAVSHYGESFLEQINRMRLPRLSVPAIHVNVPRSPRYAEGGLVSGPPAPEPAGLDLAIINASSQEEVYRALSSRRGRDIILNQIGSDGGHQVRRIIGG